jgi:hypothetical protein
MIQIIDTYIKTLNQHGYTELRKRLCPAYLALAQAPYLLTQHTCLSVIEFTNSALDLNPKKALNAAHLAASGPVYAATTLALGILGLISPSAALKTTEKVKTYLNRFDSIGPPKFPEYVAFQGWKERIRAPIYGFSISPYFIMRGIYLILHAPLFKQREDVQKALWNKGKTDINNGLKAPCHGIYALLYPNS